MTRPESFARLQRTGDDRGVMPIRALPIRALPAVLLALVLAVAGVFVGATGAQADEPGAVTEHITDDAGVLTPSETTQVQEAVTTLKDASQLQLYVIFPHDFSGATGQEWSDIVAVQSALGKDDVLLAIAADDGEFGLSVEPSLPLTNQQLGQVESAVAAQLAAGSPAQAVITAADELQAVSAEGPGGSVVLLIVIIGIAVVALVIWLVRFIAARRRLN